MAVRLVTSKAGVRLERVVVRNPLNQCRYFRVTTLRERVPVVIEDEAQAIEAFKCEVEASLTDPAVTAILLRLRRPMAL